MNATSATTGFSLGALLRAAWPADTAKHAARAAGKSYRTAEDWIADRFCPSSRTLLAMAEADDRLRAELISILSKGLNPHAPSLEEGPVLVDRRRGPVGGGADDALLRSDASEG